MLLAEDGFNGSLRFRNVLHDDAVIDWRIDFYYGRYLKFCLCKGAGKCYDEYAIYAVQVYCYRTI